MCVSVRRPVVGAGIRTGAGARAPKPIDKTAGVGSRPVTVFEDGKGMDDDDVEVGGLLCVIEGAMAIMAVNSMQAHCHPAGMPSHAMQGLHARATQVCAYKHARSWCAPAWCTDAPPTHACLSHPPILSSWHPGMHACAQVVHEQAPAAVGARLGAAGDQGALVRDILDAQKGLQKAGEDAMADQDQEQGGTGARPRPAGHACSAGVCSTGCMRRAACRVSKPHRASIVRRCRGAWRTHGAVCGRASARGPTN